MQSLFRCGVVSIVLAVCGSGVFLSCVPPNVPVTSIDADFAYPDAVRKVELNRAGYGVVRLEGLEDGSEVFLSRVNASRVEYSKNMVSEEAPADPEQLAEGSRTPAGVITMPDGEKRVIYERHWKVTPPDNDTPLASRSAVSRNVMASAAVNDTRSFYVDVKNKTVTATLKETSDHCNIWVDNALTVTIDGSTISSLATNFDKIYPAETALVGFEYGGETGDGGVDGDPKIQILVYDIDGDHKGGTMGYFYPGDEYQRGKTYPYSNEAEMFYLDAYHLTEENLPSVSSTMIHEFNHMINFNVKVIQGGQIRAWNNETWYTEMLSMLAEDAVWPALSSSETNPPVVALRIPPWVDRYNEISVMYWPPSKGGTVPYYESNYAFGAYLVRNFGGVSLFSAISKSHAAGRASIDGSLRALSPQNRDIDSTYALERFGEALVYTKAQTGTDASTNVYSFDKIAVANYSDTIYTFKNLNILNASDTPRTVEVFDFKKIGQIPMPINTVQIFQDESWEKNNIKDGRLNIQFHGVDTSATYFVLIKKSSD
ncbi:MAG: hypothetical protein LBK61_04330 [Spirochaetaceae bacterium]|jgi:hypothetical protein|nr:hypothetical protein [Spirochaetaceae bacterium]